MEDLFNDAMQVHDGSYNDGSLRKPGGATGQPPSPRKRAGLKTLLAQLEESFPKYDEKAQGKHKSLTGGGGAKAVRKAVMSNFVQVSKLMAKYDSDGSGDIDKAEFVALITALLGNSEHSTADYESFFDEFDDDKSGSISQREFKAQMKGDAKPKPKPC